jgi:hypothetical protein
MIPESILAMHRYIPADAWVRLSDRRYRTEHPNPGVVILALQAFGIITSQGCRAGEISEQETWARLLASAAELAAHRMACEERVPIVRPDNEANRGVVGHCWWCGALPEQHTGDPTATVRTVDNPGDVLVLARAPESGWWLRPIGDLIGTTIGDGPDMDEPPPYGLRSAEAAGYVVTGWRRAWVLVGYSHPDLDATDGEVAR